MLEHSSGGKYVELHYEHGKIKIVAELPSITQSWQKCRRLIDFLTISLFNFHRRNDTGLIRHMQISIVSNLTFYKIIDKNSLEFFRKAEMFI
jgi:hypothetical protein